MWSPSDRYDVELSYSHYQKYDVSTIRVPVRIRERHLVPGKIDATLQCIGPALRIAVETERCDAAIDLQLSDWTHTKPYEGSINDGGVVYVSRFDESLVVEEGEDGDTIPARVTTFE